MESRRSVLFSRASQPATDCVETGPLALFKNMLS